MKYMLLLFNAEGDPNQQPDATEMDKWVAYGTETAPFAVQTSGEALQPVATATVVSIRNGKTITSDGPFIDPKEQLGGFYVFDCKDLNHAIELAAKIPLAPTGHVEVRPIMSFE